VIDVATCPCGNAQDCAQGREQASQLQLASFKHDVRVQSCIAAEKRVMWCLSLRGADTLAAAHDVLSYPLVSSTDWCAAAQAKVE
jgi:hypothetical protein